MPLREQSERTKWAVVMSEFAPICIFLVISLLVSSILLGLLFPFVSNWFRAMILRLVLLFTLVGFLFTVFYVFDLCNLFETLLTLTKMGFSLTGRALSCFLRGTPWRSACLAISLMIFSYVIGFPSEAYKSHVFF